MHVLWWLWTGSSVMGRPSIEKFDVLVRYDAEGNPTGVRYNDQEGCGHESSTLGVDTTIRTLVQYHLDHCARSHDIHPVIMCGHEVFLKEGGRLTCTLEKHGKDAKHHFKL